MFRVLLCWAMILLPLAGLAEESKFIRLQTDKDEKPTSLDVAIVHYENDAGQKVSLVGVVHVGEKMYYSRLNRILSQYDVVLYEMVKGKQQEIKPLNGQEASENPIRNSQQYFKKLMGLEHQLDHIDYSAKNFVHADLSPEELQKIMAQSGDDAVTLTLDFLADSMRKSNLGQSEGDAAEEMTLSEVVSLALDVFFADEVRGSSKLKLIAAKQLAGSLDQYAEPSSRVMQLVISERNKACLSELSKQLDKNTKKIAIFYGAGHNPSLAKALCDKDGSFKFREVSREWEQAWSLAP